MIWMRRNESENWWRNGTGRTIGWQRKQTFPIPPLQICSTEITHQRCQLWRQYAKRSESHWLSSLPRAKNRNWPKSNRNSFQNGVPWPTGRNKFFLNWWMPFKAHHSYTGKDVLFYLYPYCQLHIPFIHPVNSTPPISKSTTQLSAIFHRRPVPTYP